MLLKLTNELLKTVCRPDFSIPEGLIPDMFRLLSACQGSGLAAPQIGFNARLFVTMWGEVYINPVIVAHTYKVWSMEGCLSFPGINVNVMRYQQIEMCGKVYVNEKAFVLQHELDHLNGITIT